MGECSTPSRTDDRGVDHEDFLSRAEILQALGNHVLISNGAQYFQLVEILSRYTKKMIGLALGLPSLLAITDEQYYADLPGGRLEATGRLFQNAVKLYVYPYKDPCRACTRGFSRATGSNPLRRYREGLLDIRTPDVLAGIRAGDPSWRSSVPPPIVEIKETRMTSSRAILFLAVALLATPARALVPGGGPAKSDCYAQWQVTTPELQANHGRTGVDCQDGDPRCDVDGQQNGTCTLGVSICVFQPAVSGCVPQEVTSVTPSRKTAALGLRPPPLPASAAACGPATLVPLALRSGRRGPRPSRPLRLKLVATSSGRPRRDPDRLTLRCIPNVGAAQCPANPSGGPRELMLAIAREGTDLDNGWTGASHNFPVVFGTQIRMCLTGCDASTTPGCTEDEAATDQVNGRTFGPPLPLFAAGIPVCLVNRFGSPKITRGAADLQSGAVSVTMDLLTDVFLSSSTQLCPRCSGAVIGATGNCDSGARQGQACRTEGVLTVTTAPPGARSYALSSDCVPAGLPAGTVAITLPLATGTSTLAGPRPCGAIQDDNCRGSACNATCTGPACESTDTSGQCVDTKGGVSQSCCGSDTTQPCFPTAGGQIVRAGSASTPAPPWPEGTYPKSESAVLTAVFCEPSSGASTVDLVTGLPGPGALTLPADAQWIR